MSASTKKKKKKLKKKEKKTKKKEKKEEEQKGGIEFLKIICSMIQLLVLLCAQLVICFTINFWT